MLSNDANRSVRSLPAFHHVKKKENTYRHYVIVENVYLNDIYEGMAKRERY